MVSSFPAVKFAQLHYRHIEKVKSEALTKNRGNYEAKCQLSDESQAELKWWKTANLKNWISPPPIILEMKTDASTGDFSPNSFGGWEATCEGIQCGGAWDTIEQTYHINTRELLAIYFALRSFRSLCENKHVRILSDNTTAIGTVNKMGSSKSLINNEISKDIWQFCEQNKIWVTATYIPGTENDIADTESRREYKEAEWKLNPEIFDFLNATLNFKPDIDYFASRLNTQLPKYVSYRPDPYAHSINALAQNWANTKGYIFPPFSLIDRVLQKIQHEKATAMVVVPVWTTQPWYTTFMEMLRSKLITIPPSPDLMTMPQAPNLVHPLHKNLTLMAGILSGKDIKMMD